MIKGSRPRFNQARRHHVDKDTPGNPDNNRRANDGCDPRHRGRGAFDAAQYAEHGGLDHLFDKNRPSLQRLDKGFDGKRRGNHGNERGGNEDGPVRCRLGRGRADQVEHNHGDSPANNSNDQQRAHGEQGRPLDNREFFDGFERIFEDARQIFRRINDNGSKSDKKLFVTPQITGNVERLGDIFHQDRRCCGHATRQRHHDFAVGCGNCAEDHDIARTHDPLQPLAQGQRHQMGNHKLAVGDIGVWFAGKGIAIARLPERQVGIGGERQPTGATLLIRLPGETRGDNLRLIGHLHHDLLSTPLEGGRAVEIDGAEMLFRRKEQRRLRAKISDSRN